MRVVPKAVDQHVEKAKSWYILAVLSMMLVIPSYWAFFDNTPYGEYLELPYAADAAGEAKNIFKPRERVYVVINFNKLRDCSVERVRQIVNDVAYTLSGSSGYMKIEKKKFMVSFQLPDSISSGAYTYRTFAMVKCNPIKTVVFRQPDVPFFVDAEPIQRGRK